MIENRVIMAVERILWTNRWRGCSLSGLADTVLFRTRGCRYAAAMQAGEPPALLSRLPGEQASRSTPFWG
jgi:hypothetical protein